MGFELAGPTGLEPATSGVTGRRSNQTELQPRKAGNFTNRMLRKGIPPEASAHRKLQVGQCQESSAPAEIAPPDIATNSL